MFKRTRVVAMLTAAVAISCGLAASAAALDESIGGFKLGSSGRGWDFTNSPYGLSEGTLTITGRVTTDALDPTSLEFELERGDGTPGVPYTDPDGIGNYNRKPNSFVGSPNASVDGLVVSRVETARGPYLRSLIKIKNNSGVAASDIARWSSDFGSDGSEVTQASSSGDKSFSKADRWVVSSEPGANDFNDDPTLAFVLRGKGVAPKALGYVPLQGPGNGSLTVFYDFKVPAGATRYFLYFTEMQGSPSAAKKSMRKYDQRHLSKSLLKGIVKKTRNRIVNWDL